MYDKMIDDYLNKVTRDMGYQQREDVKKELRSHILDSADALAAERNMTVDDGIVRDVITKMGPADKMAAGYPVKKGSILMDRVVLAIAGIIALILVLAVVAALIGACTILSLSPLQNSGFSFVTEHKESNASHEAAKNITIDVSTFNGGVEVIEADSDNVEAKVVMNAPQGRLDQITSDLNFDGNAENLKLEVEVRRLTSSVVAGGFGSFGGNVYIYVPKDSAYDMDIRTSNGVVHVANLSGKTLKLATSNAGITIDGGQYNRIEAKTSNGRVTAKYNSTDAAFETSNSAMDLDTMQTLGKIRAITSNGRISVNLPDTAGYEIDASTSNGRIRHSAMPMALTTYENNHIIGHTENFSGEDFSVYLRTSNSEIVIA